MSINFKARKIKFHQTRKVQDTEWMVVSGDEWRAQRKLEKMVEIRQGWLPKPLLEAYEALQKVRGRQHD